ncbi:hypothetical protein ACFVFS_35690 [Kitasatospora sp. NPDC057692]|uniref:hypothetical protein n=1 Tax=Kitasatospora sp. NPDC057692 TaxID=3346215 RepID=UPI0036B53239
MTTPAADMLLPPAMVADPSPLNVSTFAKPEYAKLTFTYGKGEATPTRPVHCKWFKVRIPTGRQASALTSEPTLIRYELTVPAGKRQWAVEPDTKDPNQVVFTCSPPPDEPAAFDGTWSVQLELWGIEVNGGAGPVDIIWEESTSTTGANGQFQERAGKGGVSKRDDSFYLHSFRPASVAIARNTKATLLWEGTPHAAYIMYYRKPDGTQGSSTAKDGTWTSPENLVDDSSFTLEARMGNEVRYLTTYIKVNNPDITVTTIRSPENNALTIENMPDKDHADDKVKLTFANGVLSVTSNGTYSGAISTISIAASEINGRGAGVLGLNGAVTVSGALAAGGLITANEGITLAEKKTIKTDYINARVAADGIVVGDNLSMYPGRTLAADTLTANGTLTAKGDVEATATDKKVRIANLYGPYGVPLEIQSLLNVAGGLTANSLITANEGIAIGAKKTIKTDYINARVAADGIVVGDNLSMYPGMTFAADIMRILGTPWKISQAFVPQTDGLVIGFGSGPEVFVNGGMGAPTTMSRDTKDSIVIPVKGGTGVSLSRYDSGAWYYIPFGVVR